MTGMNECMNDWPHCLCDFLSHPLSLGSPLLWLTPGFGLCSPANPVYLRSVLGPLGVSSHQYADAHMQVYLHSPAATDSSMVECFLEASDALHRWLSSNRLRLNQDKTHHIWLVSRAQLSKFDFDSLRLRYPNVHFSSSVRDLGFILDPVLTSILSIW